MNLKFSLKEPKAGESAVLIETRVSGAKHKFYAPIGKIQTKNWSTTKREVLSGQVNHIHLNQTLKKWKAEVERLLLKFQSEGQIFSREIFSTELNTSLGRNKPVQKVGGKPTDLIGFFDWYCNQNKHWAGRVRETFAECRRQLLFAYKLVSESQMKAYRAAHNYAKSKKDLTPCRTFALSKIDYDKLVEFRDHLCNLKVLRRGEVVSLSAMSILKHMKKYKQVLSAAMTAGLIPIFPMRLRSDLKVSAADSDAVYLDLQEIQSLAALDLEGEQEKIRDLFLFNCFCGMRWSDLSDFSSAKYDRRTNLFTDTQQKTGTKVQFPIPANALIYLEKYNYELPVFNYDRFNKTIKLICKQAGLTQLVCKSETRGFNQKGTIDVPKYALVSTHTARRSFCTNSYKLGIPCQLIRKVSGHTTESEFKKYIRNTDIDAAKMEQEFGRFPALIAPLKKVA
jgi:site-specific recombinase XerD